MQTHIASLVKKRHTAGRKALLDILKTDAKHIALLTDALTSTATESYNATTTHFIHGNWELRSCVLETSLFPESHTGENVNDKVHAAVEAFLVPDSNAIAIVHDEAASMMKAGRKIKEFGWETTACSAHLLQTFIRHAIDSNGPISNLAKARKFGGHFKHSALATTALCAAQVERRNHWKWCRTVQQNGTVRLTCCSV